MDYASKQLNKIGNRIRDAAQQAGREYDSICLIGASKKQTVDTLAAFNAAGLKNVGENFLQEALIKQTQLSDLGQSLQWHYIGRIQSNKARDLAKNFSWIHGVDRLKVAQRLSNQVDNAEKLNVLIQLNVDQETSKAGIPLEHAERLCGEISELPNLRLRGFMIIPAPRTDLIEQRRPFASAKQCLDRINQQLGLAMDTLSMGMSTDLEAAISEGSTMIRVGTDLFGARPD